MAKARTAKPPQLPYTVEQEQRNVFRVRIPYRRAKDWEQWFLLSSDRHWDNPKSDHKLQKAHLEEARERNAGVIDCGDFFCAMQGKYDKRADKSSVRPEHNVSNYLDALVDTAADFFAPHADRFIVIGTGNHEQAIAKRHETHLTQRLVGQLNRNGASVYCGGFSGWVRFQFGLDAKGHQHSQPIYMHYDHGYGGGGPVTKGVIQSNRRAVYLPDAHIVISGHVHEDWRVEIPRVRLSQGGKTYHDIQTHVCLATYKEEYGDGFEGWHPERGAPPKPIGAAWLRFFYSGRHDKILYEITRAQ